MKDSNQADQAIDKVLAGLGKAEAPVGMERRILETMQSRASAGARWGWRWMPGRFPVGAAACAAALAGVVALVLAVPAIRHRPASPTRSAKAVPSTPAAPLPAMENAELQRPASATRSPRRAKPRKLEVADPEEALAVREMNAPSRPAPPLPLTAQEKALVRFVRTRTPEELAAIDPAKWAAQDEQQRAEFDRFFRRFTKEQADKKKLAEEAMNKS